MLLYRFPTNISFRLFYVFFLMEKMRYKQQSLQELNEIDELNPPLYIQFILFRYKLINFIYFLITI